ncbi:MAG TPA: SUMF1/EgtB/PvdO family nonheme iron enzyme, partial [Gemmataceae bacterium]|nr:SUMF1/EgtB/PvdO family nonheme iron enzyme [Gemmataceae bacterium]
PSCTAFFEALAQAVPFSSSAQRQLLAGTPAAEGLPEGLLANADTASGVMGRIDTPTSARKAQAQTLARSSKVIPTPVQQEPVHWRPAPRPRSRRPLLVIAVGICVIAVMAGIGFWLKNWSPKPVPEPPPEPPPATADYVPHDCEPVKDAVLEKAGSRQLWNRIEYVRDGLHVPFVLVLRAPGTGAQPFYIMQDKVTNGLFKKFVQSPKGAQWAAPRRNDWHDGAIKGEDPSTDVGSEDDELPVFRVTAEQAQTFAEWLGGDLPTMEQWDTAAGAYDHDNGVEGPYQAGAEEGEIAVGRAKEGPMRVTQVGKDISRFGCHQMAGNGKEWTRTPWDREQADTGVPTKALADPKTHVCLRGASYRDSSAWKFNKEPDEQPCVEAGSQISFRVVLKIQPADAAGPR